MNQVRRILIWLSRINHCRGFGVQSPTDYSIVRYVINEHWPYYQYATLGQNDHWLSRKLGRLYMRLANWRQPEVIVTGAYNEYWQAGCRRATLTKQIPQRVELMHTDIDNAANLMELLEGHTDNQTVVVVERLWHNWEVWHKLAHDQRCTVTFNLYYCGLLMFDKKRTKQNYKINF